MQCKGTFRIQLSCLESLLYCPHNIFRTVQRKFTKYLYFKKYGTYPTLHYPHDILLRQLNLVPLSARRDYYLLMFLFKIFHNIIQDSALLEYIHILVPRSNNVRQPMLFHCNVVKSNQHFYSPLVHMQRLYNKYRQSLDLFGMTLHQFQWRLLRGGRGG